MKDIPPDITDILQANFNNPLIKMHFLSSIYIYIYNNTVVRRKKELFWFY